MPNHKIPTTANFQFLHSNTKPIVLLEGSTRSTKTYSIVQYLILRCISENIRVFAGRHDGSTCEDSIIPDFKDVMTEQFEMWESTRWNGTKKRYTFASGSTFAFGGTSDSQKLHGRKQDILWLNEVMEISYSAWKQLSQRTTTLIIADWNPSLTHHWVFDRVMKRDQSEYAYRHSTYAENPFLTAGQVAEIESAEPTDANKRAGTADEWHWQVYGLGKRGRREGVIFRLWQVTEQFPDRLLCQRFGYGMDFGFSLDPSTLIECALWQDEVYLRQRIWEPQLLITRNESQPQELSIQGHMEDLHIDKTLRIHADCAAPGSIRDLRLAGYNVVPCVKGADSINHGISILKRYRIHVHIDSQDLQRELENYCWHQRPDGTWDDKPADEWNHGIDAARYWAMAELKAQRQLTRKPTVVESVLTRRHAPRRMSQTTARSPLSRRGIG